MAQFKYLRRWVLAPSLGHRVHFTFLLSCEKAQPLYGGDSDYGSHGNGQSPSAQVTT